MTEICVNPCQISRDNAGLTQADAAPELLIGVRTLSDYENGKTPVPADVIKRMQILYNDPFLGYRYISEILEIGRDLLPRLPTKVQPTECVTDLFICIDDLEHKAITTMRAVRGCPEAIEQTRPLFQKVMINLMSLMPQMEAAAGCIVQVAC